MGRGLGDRGGRGVLTSVRMRLASSVSVVAPCRGGFADTNTVVFVVLTKNPASSRFKAVFLKQAALTVLRIMMMVLMIMMLMLLITMMLVGMMIMMIMMLMLLLAHAQDNDGDDDNSDDNKDNGNVAPCCSCFHVTSETLPIQKSRVLKARRTKTSKIDANLKQTKQRQPPYLRHFRKNTH